MAFLQNEKEKIRVDIMENTKANESNLYSATYDTFDAFLGLAIKEYYQRKRGLTSPNFVALLIASGQTLNLAKNSLGSTQGLKKLALGTVGIMAARVILTRLITGPIGLILTGVSVASVIALLIKNQKEIFAKVGRYKELIEKTRVHFEEAQTGYRQNRMDAHERNLIIDGLMTRFINECDQM